MNSGYRVLRRISKLYQVPVSRIAHKEYLVQEFKREGKVANRQSFNPTKPFKRSRKQKETEARWCWWLYLESLGYTYTKIARREGFNHQTVYHGLNNRHLVLNKVTKEIIYGTDL